MLGICSKEELDEEDEEAEEEVVAEGDEAEPELTGASEILAFSDSQGFPRLTLFERNCRGRNCRTTSCDQEQDFGSWENVETLLGSSVRNHALPRKSPEFAADLLSTISTERNRKQFPNSRTFRESRRSPLELSRTVPTGSKNRSRTLVTLANPISTTNTCLPI